MAQQRVPTLHFPISHQLHVFRLNRAVSDTISLSLSLVFYTNRGFLIQLPYSLSLPSKPQLFLPPVTLT